MSSWLFDTSDRVKEEAPALELSPADNDAYVLAEDDKLSNTSMETERTFDSDQDVLVEVLGAPPPNSFVEWNSRWSGRIVKDRRFKRAIIFLIMLNSIIMGIGTFDFVTENPRATALFDTFDTIFLVIFSGEIILQALHYRMAIFKDGWLLFDTTIVLLSWFFASLLVIRAFRIVRTLRLATRIQPLKSVISALLRAVPKMLAVAFLLTLLFYIFAVLFTTMYKDLYRDGLTSEDYFSRVDITAFTLFQIMTLDGWSEVTKEVMATNQWAWLPFMSFIIVSSFTFLNLVIAVLCEAVSNIHHEKHEERVKEIQSAPPEQVSKDIARLERKIDELTNKLEFLLCSHHDSSDRQQQGVVSLE